MKDNLLADLQKLLTQRRSKVFYSEKLGISVEEVEELLKELRKKDKEEDSLITDNFGITSNIKDVFTGTFQYRNTDSTISNVNNVKVNNDKGTIESEVEATFEPKDDIELAKLHKIDLTKYKISTYWSKLKSNGKFTSSVLATLKKPKEFSTEDFAKFIVNYKPTPVEVRIYEVKYSTEWINVEISIADFHLDRLTLQRNNIQSRSQEYLSVLSELVKSSTALYNIDRFIFPIGNDFFNNDNYQGSTTSLTPQDNSVSWNEAYEVGFDTLAKAISILKAFSNTVEVVLVQGNHDRTKSYYLAHALEIYFKNSASVLFNRKHSTTKHTISGNTFIGYHHGNTKIDDLPLVFATSPETSEAFGKAKYREVKTADKHFYMSKEIKGVRIQQIPSMVNPDRWSEDNNFIHNVRAAIAVGYHPIKGRCFEFEERV